MLDYYSIASFDLNSLFYNDILVIILTITGSDIVILQQSIL